MQLRPHLEQQRLNSTFSVKSKQKDLIIFISIRVIRTFLKKVNVIAKQRLMFITFKLLGVLLATSETGEFKVYVSCNKDASNNQVQLRGKIMDTESSVFETCGGHLSVKSYNS